MPPVYCATMSSIGSQTMSLLAPTPDEEPGFSGGLSDPNTTQFRHRRYVLNIINSLQSYGLQNQLDLPQIAVIGSQSVGKSSLIESISGITLPRAKGTCTRCPIECRLSRTSSDWSCEVYLRTRRQAREIQFGPTITDKDEVEDRIRRAQLAILNPSIRAVEFLSSDFPTIRVNERSFSSDLISVRISGRDVDDLSFVDLPGLIASVRDGGREEDIEEVRALVTSFVNKPSCLILLVVSCETDLENQGARRLAKRVDPTGTRTIPVLTKPDRIPVLEHTGWVRLLENQQERFKHGWYCVKQPDQQQLDDGISWEEARQNESSFFETTSPWSTLEGVKSRLGTRFLTPALGTILFKLICKRLPGLLREVSRKLQLTKESIANLPDKLEGNPIAIVLRLLTAFEKDVTRLVSGRPEDGAPGLMQTFRKSRCHFYEAIFNQAPDFRPYPRDSSGRKIEYTHSLTTEGHERLEPTGIRDDSIVVYLDEVFDTAENAITRELPHNYPYAVKMHYVSRFTEKWLTPAKDLFEKLERHFLIELKELVTKHFSSFSAGGLEDRVLRTVIARLKICSNNTQEKLNECISIEREEPVTSNEHYLADYKEKFMSRYKAVGRLYNNYNSSLHNLVDGKFENTAVMNNAVQNLHQMGIQKVNSTTILKMLPSENVDVAIEIMAEVRAYYQVAFKRFVDYAAMIIDYHLLKGFDRSIEAALFDGLSLGEGETMRERCQGYLQEDPMIVQRRMLLQQDLERFEAALIDLQHTPGISLSDYESDDDDVRHLGTWAPNPYHDDAQAYSPPI